MTENLLLKEELAVRRGAPQLVGEDPSLRKVFASLQRAAATDATVLLEGESGTGKELFARSLHALSPRADAPFVAINCAAIPENLLETELFGYEKGAFTGAVGRKPGKFEMAHRGTLFLDEIGDLPMSLQAKILRALEEKKFERVGGTALLLGRRAAGRGHQQGPAGRRRGAPVPRGSLLPAVGVSDHDSAAARSPGRHPGAGALLRRSLLPRSEEAALRARRPAAIEQLQAYRWPGNVRELQNCIERAVILADGETLLPRHLNLSFAAPLTDENPESPWTHVDMSGTLADVDAPRDGRSREGQDRGSRCRRRPATRGAPRSCCRSPTSRCCRSSKNTGSSRSPA